MRAGMRLLASYPKSGNTWMRLALQSLVAGGADIWLSDAYTDWTERSDAMFHMLANRKSFDETMLLESSDLTFGEISALMPSYASTAGMSDPYTVVKIHDAWRTASGATVFPESTVAGVVYIVRDPRDVAPSLAHHLGKSPDDAIGLMANAKFILSPQYTRVCSTVPQYVSDWSAHVTGWLDAGLPLLAVKYEEMLADTAGVLRRVADFLEIPADAAAIRGAVEATRFGRLQKREQETGFQECSPVAANFFRRGVAGGWRDTLSPAQVDKIERDHGDVMRRLGYQDSV